MSIRIIYMGTPDFSVPALRVLAQHENITIPVVVTQPDRPKGRGKKLSRSPVKKAALDFGLDVFQPRDINLDESVETLSRLEPDFFVVAAFGQILTPGVLNIPKHLPINIHASLLPKYRGASPIQAAIRNMEKETGVTTMVMTSELDAGDMLMKDSIPVIPSDTAQDLHDRLSVMGADLIGRTIENYLENKIKPVPQDHTKASYAKLLKKKDGWIDWQLSAREICAHINAMTPWPSAFTRFENKPFKIFKAVPSNHESGYAPGVIFHCGKESIDVATGKGSIKILELMGPSGKRLEAFQFLCGTCIYPPCQFDPQA